MEQRFFFDGIERERTDSVPACSDNQAVVIASRVAGSGFPPGPVYSAAGRQGMQNVLVAVASSRILLFCEAGRLAGLAQRAELIDPVQAERGPDNDKADQLGL